MTTNFDVVREFNIGSDERIKASNLFFEGNILYSYGYHFPLCIKLLDGYIVNSNGYSMTTSTHKGILIREITNEGNFKEFEKNKKDYPNIILMTTSQIKSLNENLKDIKTIKELKNCMILGELENE